MKQMHVRKSHANKIQKSRLIIGRKPMIEALESGASIDKIFILQSASGNEIHTIKSIARQQNVAVSLVPQQKLDRLTAVPNQGVVAIAGLIQYLGLQDVIDQVVAEGGNPLFVVLDGVTDTRNLGAIARSAHIFGAHAVVIPASNSAAVTEEAVKTSAGALAHIAICREASVEQIIDLLHLNGITTFATSPEGVSIISETNFDCPLAIIMGAEDKGVSGYTLKKAHKLVKIPQSNNFDSLNVSVAAGVILYEIFKNRIK